MNIEPFRSISLLETTLKFLKNLAIRLCKLSVVFPIAFICKRENSVWKLIYKFQEHKINVRGIVTLHFPRIKENLCLFSAAN